MFFVNISLTDYEGCMDILHGPQSFVNVPEYLWYGEDLVKLAERLEEDPRYKGRFKSELFGSMSSKNQRREWL